MSAGAEPLALEQRGEKHVQEAEHRAAFARRRIGERIAAADRVVQAGGGLENHAMRGARRKKGRELGARSEMHSPPRRRCAPWREARVTRSPRPTPTDRSRSALRRRCRRRQAGSCEGARPAPRSRRPLDRRGLHLDRREDRARRRASGEVVDRPDVRGKVRAGDRGKAPCRVAPRDKDRRPPMLELAEPRDRQPRTNRAPTPLRSGDIRRTAARRPPSTARLEERGPRSRQAPRAATGARPGLPVAKRHQPPCRHRAKSFPIALFHRARASARCPTSPAHRVSRSGAPRHGSIATVYVGVDRLPNHRDPRPAAVTGDAPSDDRHADRRNLASVHQHLEARKTLTDRDAALRVAAARRTACTRNRRPPRGTGARGPRPGPRARSRGHAYSVPGLPKFTSRCDHSLTRAPSGRKSRVLGVSGNTGWDDQRNGSRCSPVFVAE